MSYPVIDLHSDLLSFLTHREGRSIDDPHSRNSIGQMLSGNVKLQTLAIFSKTGMHSVAQGKKQLTCFEQLLRTQKERGIPVQLIAAFENASAFASEEEPLSHALTRLQEVLDTLEHLFYITMTWDGENRFGGGVGSTAGLKEDGKQLLQWLSGKQVAIDLSHTSDKLAAEILEHIDKRSLTIPLLASHSNFRRVTQMPRNLPDAIACEIIRRKGLIGINLFAPFIDRDDPSKLLDHFAHGLALGGADALCFGADFFCESDFPSIKEKYPYPHLFFDVYSDSSTYPHILQLLEKELKASSELLHNISHKNVSSFLVRDIFCFLDKIP